MNETLGQWIHQVDAPPQSEMPASMKETQGATSISLAASAMDRILLVPFLLIGLTAWAIGVTLVLANLLRQPGIAAFLPAAFRRFAVFEAPTVVRVFLLMAFVFVTIGGIAACSKLFRRVAGRDVIELRPLELACWNSVAFAGFERVYPREQIASVFLRGRDEALTIRTTEGRQRVLTRFGTRDERLWLEREIRNRYVPENTGSTPVPEIDTSDISVWEVEQRDGGLLIRNSAKMRMQLNGLATFVVLLVEAFTVIPMVAGTINGDPGSITFGRIVVAIAATAFLVYVYRAREWWIVRENYLFHGVAFGKWKKEEQFTNARLSIGSTQQKSGTRYSLTCSVDGEDGKAPRETLLASARDLYEVRSCADLVSATTRWAVDSTMPR